MSEWTEWQSGDHIGVPDEAELLVEQTEILRRVATGFRRAVIDWTEGDRWAEARAAKAEEIGFRGFLLEAERALRGQSVLVSVADDPGLDAVWMRFYLTSVNQSLEVGYVPTTAVKAGRALAVKLAGLLECDFVPWEEEDDAEPDDAADDREPVKSAVPAFCAALESYPQVLPILTGAIAACDETQSLSVVEPILRTVFAGTVLPENWGRGDLSDAQFAVLAAIYHNQRLWPLAGRVSDAVSDIGLSTQRGDWSQRLKPEEAAD